MVEKKSLHCSRPRKRLYFHISLNLWVFWIIYFDSSTRRPDLRTKRPSLNDHSVTGQYILEIQLTHTLNFVPRVASWDGKSGRAKGEKEKKSLVVSIHPVHLSFVCFTSCVYTGKSGGRGKNARCQWRLDHSLKSWWTCLRFSRQNILWAMGISQRINRIPSTTAPVSIYLINHLNVTASSS